MDTYNSLYRFCKVFTVSLVFTFLFLCSFASVYAQSTYGSDVVIDAKPSRPSPGEEVSLRLETKTVDFSETRVTWELNGQIVKQEYDQDRLSFTAGQVGSITRVTATLEDGTGRTIVEKIVRVGDVAMVWEGKTYTPPFYEGRSLRSRGADVIVKTIPLIKKDNGALFDKNELVYEWSIDGSRAVVDSGKGLHTIVLENKKPYADLKVFVEIKDLADKTVGGGEVLIPSTVPELLLYEDSPYVGVHYSSAIGKKLGVYGGDVRTVAEPYYMSASSRIDPILTYTWTVDGTEYNHPGTLSFGPQENEQTGEYSSGSARLRLLVENETYWHQNARIDKEILFGTRDAWRDINPETPVL